MSGPTVTPYHKTWKDGGGEKPPPASDPQKSKKPRNRKKLWARIGVLALVLFGIGVIGVVGIFAWYSRDLPDPDKLLERELAQSTRIYDRTGETLLYEIHGDVKRTLVQLEDIPDHFKNATIAIEDKNFYTHSGFSIAGYVRAAWINITSAGRRRPGGSTITQQLVKNAILTTEKTYTRKIKELVLSYQLERKFSKDQILKLYFNEIPYGSVSYGVESAAQIYFSKSAKNLTLAESAILAALPQSPTYYSPYGSHVEDLIGRQHHILDLMVELGMITSEEAETAKTEELLFSPPREQITAPHFVFYVKEQLTEKYGEKLVEQGGLKVITTLDTHKQEVAEQSISDGMAKVQANGGSNAALAAMDPKTGEILAMVGSADYFDSANDGNVNVTIRPRQPGSSFKPVAYATAFAKGYTPETMLFDVTTNFGGNPAYIPKNYDGGEHGPISMRRALAGSLNIPAVKTLYLAGLDDTLETAKELGYSTLTDPDRYGLSLVLGGGEVTLLEHVGAFGVFAREGLRHPSASILRVEDSQGQVLEEFSQEEFRVMEEKVARNINSILSDNSARSYVFGSRSHLLLSDRPVAAKTGTTNDYRDAWTLGYTPSLAAGVWVGNNDNTSMNAGADGSVVAAPIWNAFMNGLLSGTPVETFKSPAVDSVDTMMVNGQIDLVREVPVDRLTGRAIPEECRDSYPSEFVTTKQYKETHTILHYLWPDFPRGDPPDDPNADSQYARWEAAVQLWASGQPGYITPNKPLQYENCNLREGSEAPSDKITLTTPRQDAVVTQSPLVVTLDVDKAVSLQKVETYLDDSLLKTVEEAPFLTSIDVSEHSNGFYELKVLVYASDDNIYTFTRDINLLLTSESSSLYFTAPKSGTKFDASDWPLTISGVATHPDGVIRIAFEFTNESKEKKVIGTLTDIDGSLFEWRWTEAPSPGTYTLTPVLATGNDVTMSGDPLTIIVK
ncbi:MAG: PBP1A family penicillin-binding protein [bacterium]|nr:PBP1A family penicillin-binding protein [bacterium]